jgi:hypothetical protein
MTAGIKVSVKKMGMGVCLKCSNPERIVELELEITGHDGTSRTSRAQFCPKCLVDKNHFVGLEDVVFPTDTFQDRSANKKSAMRKIVKKRERQCAEDIGGRVTPGSGAFNIKGDAVNDKWVIDDKTTKAKSFRVDRDMISKILGDAQRAGKKGALRIGVDNMDVAVIHWKDFIEIIGEK